MELTFSFPPHSPLTLSSVDENCSVSELKTKLFSILPGIYGGNIEGEDEMRLVCGGRVLQDHLTLSGQGVENGSKVYVAVKRVASVVPQAKPPQVNRKKESDPLMGPLLKFLSDNPELYQQMILSNPQMQKLIEKNPELRHALSDPSTLKSMLNAATNPKAYNELLRGHDRAMSNLENIPEGFSHLKKVYSTLQEPMYDAFTPKTTRVNYNELADNQAEEKMRRTTSEPVPNPWAPKTPTPMRPSSSVVRNGGNPIFGTRKRKLTSLIDEEDEDLFNRSLAGIAEMGLSSPLGIINKNELYGQQLKEMHLLGFVNDEENVAALVESEGNISVAIDRIVAKRGGRNEVKKE